MEYNLDAFFNSLISYIGSSPLFPYMKDEELDEKKHPNRNPLHLKDAIFNSIQPIHSLNSITFDIGNANLENTHPYYHILEQAQVIRKRGRGTTKSRGSQAKVQDVGSRDYERVSWNGKTFTKEYRRNVRGSRSLLDKAQKRAWLIDDEGIAIPVYENRQSPYYANKHYHYIENILESGILDMLATEFGMRRMRTKDTGLGEEMALQEFMEQGTDEATNMLNIFNSFEGE